MAVTEYESPKLTLTSLWTDTRYRSITMQILVLAGLFATVFFLVSNAISNLALLDKDVGFDFLRQPAGYDINQTLIEYTSRSTHARAAVVGLLNTFLVAIVGIFIATIFGFLLGIARLSHNWLVNRIAYVYLEFVRNVPVLVHILLVHGVIVTTLPVARQAISLGDIAFLSNRGFNLPRPIPEDGFSLVLIAFAIGIAFTIWFARWAHRVQDQTGKIYPVFWIGVGAVVGFPVLVFLVLGMPLSFDYPALRGFNFRGGFVIRPEFAALTLALSMYTAAFIGEIVRAGITAISHGQTEAAYALGLRPGRTLRLIIIPQALRVIVPPLTSQYLNLTKNSSLAIAIGYMDIVATIGGITLNQTGRELECMAIVMGIYLVLSLLISAFMNWYNRRIALVER